MNTSGHLTIAEPCHENWQDMSQQEQGRHCEKCCKVVVDFTEMPTEKVIAFISERKAEKICGRFRSGQIRPSSLVSRPSNRYRIFFAALYFVFGGILFSSCGTDKHKMGKVAVSNSFDDPTARFNSIDTPSSRSRNKIDKINITPIGAQKPVCNKADTTETEIFKLGEVMYIPNDTIQK